MAETAIRNDEFDANRKVTPAQIVKELKGLVAVIHELESTEKGEFDDTLQLAFDELVGTACLLQDQIYCRAAATDAEMRFAQPG